MHLNETEIYTLEVENFTKNIAKKSVVTKFQD